jgi:hypothetical protein
MNLIWAGSISLDSTFKLLAPGILHGPVPAGRAENHLPENHHSGHEKAACRLQVHLLYVHCTAFALPELISSFFFNWLFGWVRFLLIGWLVPSGWLGIFVLLVSLLNVPPSSSYWSAVCSYLLSDWLGILVLFVSWLNVPLLPIGRQFVFLPSVWLVGYSRPSC